MSRTLARHGLPAALLPLALLSLAWGGHHALATSDDLLRRWAEIDLFVRGLDPFQLPSMTYPPSALPIFAPLVAPFGPEGVKWAWLGLNLLALAVLCLACLRLWGRAWPGWLQAAFALAVVAAKPVRGGIGMGQFHLIPTALGVLAFLAIERRRPIVAGLLLGVALAKPTMVLPLVVLLLVRGEWRALVAASAVQLAGLAGASAWLGVGPTRLVAEWLANARGQADAGAIDVPSLVLRTLPGLPIGPTALMLAVLAAAGLVMVAARRRADGDLVPFGFLVAAVFTYHRPYDLVLLVPAFAAAVEAGRRSNGWRRAAAVGFGLLLIAPSHPAAAGPLAAWHDPAFAIFAHAWLATTVVALVRSDRAGAPSAPQPQAVRTASSTVG